MASDATVLIFSALFPDTNGNIPPDKAAIVPALLSHIKAMEQLVQHGRVETHKAQFRSIRDPRLSALVTDRIMELHGQMGPDWKGIACTIAQEFHETLTIDGVRGRYKKRAAQLEAHAAMSGEVFSMGPSTPEPELLGNPEQLPETPKEDALKAEVRARHARGEEVKNIAEALGVRWQWVRAVCAKAPKPEPSSAIIREQPAPVVPLNAMDARIQEMAEQGAMVHEICIAINRNFNHNYSTAEMAEKIRKLQGGANASR